MVVLDITINKLYARLDAIVPWDGYPIPPIIQTIDPSYVCTAMTEYRLVMPLCNLRSIKTVRVSYCFYA